MANKPQAEAGEKVPLWIISFADMITLLLSFFVMLQTMSHHRDSTLFGLSQDSFRRAIAGLGIPDILFGKASGPPLDYKKLKYPTEESIEEGANPRVIDADDEQIRKLFSDLTQQVDTKTSNPSEKVLQLIAAPVSFSEGGVNMDGKSSAQLNNLAEHLRDQLKADHVRIYVIGTAANEATVRQQWIVSAQRARVVGQLLEKALTTSEGQLKWHVASWGAGASSEVLEVLGKKPGNSGILIAIMGETNRHGK